MTEKDILKLIEQDSWMMEILKAVRALDLPDAWIGAGFVRSKVWDSLHGYQERTPLPDIDVIYFDKNNFTEIEETAETTKSEQELENKLNNLFPGINWSATNQARMHSFHNDPPYKNSTEGLAQWVETATCVGVRLDKNNKLELTSPRGIDDLVNLVLRPTFNTPEGKKIFLERIEKKQWLKKWPKLRIEY